MADVEKLKSALIQAHNSGDTEAAQLFASKIKELQSSDFTNKLALLPQDDVEELRSYSPRYARLSQKTLNLLDSTPAESLSAFGIRKPTAQELNVADMSTGQRALAGAGKAFVDTGRGIDQLATDINLAVQNQADSGSVYNPLTWAAKAGKAYNDLAGVNPQETANQLNRDELSARQMDAPLISTKSGFAGNMAGNAAVAAPTMLNPASATYKGAAAIGAGLGALQPTVEGESKLANAAVGAAGGVAGQAIGQVIGAIGKRIITAFADKPAHLLNDAAIENQIKVTLSKAPDGVQWDELNQGAKQALMDVAKNPGMLEQLGPEGVSNLATIKAMPVQPETVLQGQITRDPVQQIKENAIAATGRFNDVYKGQEQAINQSADAIGKRFAPKSSSKIDIGQAQRSAIQVKKDLSDALTKQGYDFAESMYGDVAGNAKPLSNYLAKNEHLFDPGNVPELKAIKSMLDASTERNGGINKIPMLELDEIRKQAQSLSSGGRSSMYMGKIKELIDNIQEKAGVGAYKDAVSQARATFNEFDDRALTSALLANKGKMLDPKVADEKIFDMIANAPVAQIQDYKRTLLSANNPQLRRVISNEDTRPAAIEAFQKLRRGVVDDIINKARSSSNDEILPASLQRSYDRYGDDKLKELLGPGAQKQLKNLVAATKIMKVSEKGTVPQGSGNTILRILYNMVPGLKGVAGETTMKVTSSIKGAAQAETAKSGVAGLLSQASKADKQRAYNALLEDPKWRAFVKSGTYADGLDKAIIVNQLISNSPFQKKGNE